jgi:hypothetical protein
MIVEVIVIATNRRSVLRTIDDDRLFFLYCYLWSNVVWFVQRFCMWCVAYKFILSVVTITTTTMDIVLVKDCCVVARSFGAFGEKFLMSFFCADMRNKIHETGLKRMLCDATQILIC